MKHAAHTQSYWLKTDAGIGSTAPPAMVSMTKRVKCILHIINARNDELMLNVLRCHLTY